MKGSLKWLEKDFEEANRYSQAIIVYMHESNGWKKGTQKQKDKFKTLIESNKVKAVFSFAANKAVENVHPKLLRVLLARTYKLVRSDISRRSVDVNFEMISNILENDDDLPKLYGVSIFAEMNLNKIPVLSKAIGCKNVVFYSIISFITQNTQFD